MTIEPIVTTTATCSLGDDAILRLVVHQDAEETVATARENIDALMRLADGQRRPLLVDNRPGRAIEPRARRLWSTDEATAFFTCTAILVKPGLSRAIGNFMIGVLHSNREHRLFDSESDALEWCKTFVE